jgi:hypothetical protein
LRAQRYHGDENEKVDDGRWSMVAKEKVTGGKETRNFTYLQYLLLVEGRGDDVMLMAETSS